MVKVKHIEDVDDGSVNVLPAETPIDEKLHHDKASDVKVEGTTTPDSADAWVPPADWREKLRDEYTGEHSGETLPPGSNVDRVVDAVLTLSPKESVKALEEIIVWHARDLSFMQPVMDRIKELVQGAEACDMSEDDWAYETCRTAGLLVNYSPYPEVRAVTLPYDDPDEPCETIRAWVLGIFWLIGCTCVNTCESLFELFSATPSPGMSVNKNQNKMTTATPLATFQKKKVTLGDQVIIHNFAISTTSQRRTCRYITGTHPKLIHFPPT